MLKCVTAGGDSDLTRRYALGLSKGRLVDKHTVSPDKHRRPSYWSLERVYMTKSDDVASM